MKTFSLILSATLLSFSLTTNAQKGEEPVRLKPSSSVPAKGYYAIGNNAAKLQTPPAVSGFQVSKKKTKPQVQKGYYATGNNKAKLADQVSFEEVAPSGQTNYKAKPTKGYYAIGRNAEKLK